MTLLLLLPLSAAAEILVVDFVKVLDGNDEEARYYYEKNWKKHRIEAAKRGYISSYKLMIRTSDDGVTDIVLMTGFASESAYQAREENFEKVMAPSREKGVRLLNEKTPGEFRKVVDNATYVSD
ncbi:MAG: hypothetical protein AAGI27_16800 [Pseudomonadota bacterium]